MSAKALRSIYQLKISLKMSKPEIWRRLHITSTCNLEQLHIAIQIAMGWTNAHLHEFSQGEARYGAPDSQMTYDIYDESEFRLAQLFRAEGDRMHYVYDFGDGWEHDIVLEKILPFATDIALPFCIEGQRACPPEDVGGIPGYELLLETISDPSHPDYDDVLEWLGGDYDADHLDLPLINDLLQEYCA